MKTFFLSFFIVLFSTSTFADQIRINCSIKGKSGFVKILKNDGMPPEISLYKSGHLLVRLMDSDVFEIYQGHARTNVEAVHHNTVIKLSADYDIFGGELGREGEEEWRGVLYLSPNLSSEFGNKKHFIISCSHEA